MPRSPVHVVATSDAGTLSALQTASAIATERAADIVLVIPVERRWFMRRRPLEPGPLVEMYRRLADRAGVAAVVRLCLCGRRRDVFDRLLIRYAQVVVGGSRGPRWWPSAEERLAAQLAAAGHRVRFAEVDEGRATVPAPFASV